MKQSLTVLLISLFLSGAAVAEIRDFTNKDGKTIQGELVDLRDEKSACGSRAGSTMCRWKPSPMEIKPG